ncbi:hypothetical protein D3C87_278450 [compost metagenome]
MTQLSNLLSWIEPDGDHPDESFFPLRVKYLDREESEVISTPTDLRIGMGFTVLQTNV